MTLAFASLWMLSSITAPAALADLPTLIPRAVLFGNPEKTAPNISPDGKMLAYLAPDRNHVLAIWVRTIGKTDDRVVASDPKRPIRNVAWQPDSAHVIYEQDKSGDENFHVFQTDIGHQQTRDLTPFAGVRAGIDDIDQVNRTTMLIDMNKRDKKVFDVYRVDFKSGDLTLDTQNPGNISGWVADNALRIRAAVQANQDGSTEILVRDTVRSPWRTLLKASADDQIAPQAFSADNASLYLTSTIGVNAAQLMRYDLKAGTQSVVFADPTFDVGYVATDPKTREIVAVNVERDRSEWTVLEPKYAGDFAAIKALHPGDFSFTSSSRDGRHLIISYVVDNGPVSWYAYNRATKKGTFLFVARPALSKYALAHMQPVSYKASDGLTIHGYLTLPTGVQAHNLPMVLFVHGGPWGRDSWGYSSYAQWLANRGYAVLQPNFRGSTGYGKDFLNAGDRQWAGRMHQDLVESKAWAVSQGYADPKRVAIMGGSYGGYATLAGVAFSPDAFAAGVDIVGPSNLNTLLASIPPYWATGLAQFRKRMGDTEAFLNTQSPLFKADQIKVPLLIGQGANDPRVNKRESDQIVAAMRKNHEP
ncbi:MAG: S9 family peptidase, partial [Candidatus Eremiobacteraeota bacterium]|nr:S9 family peptidase [Candidatus Eremiobacteraeota bacterium]